MRKATVKKIFLGRTYGDLGRIVNLRQAIDKGNKEYGVGYYFVEIDKEELEEYLKEDKDIICGLTLSNKYVEIDKNNIDNFIL